MLDAKVETFLCVCRCMNFTKAAELLHITQPAVSVQMRQLEEEYQVKLFHYEGRQLSLTKEGEILYQAMMTMKHDEGYLKEHLKENGGHMRKMKMGATKTVGDFVLPHVMGNFLKKNLDVSLKVKVANTGELLKDLDECELDFALVEGYFDKSRYTYRNFSKERFVAVSAEGQWAERKTVELEEVFLQPLFIREPGSGTREILERELAGRNYSIKDFRQVHEVSNIHLIRRMVLENCGISFLYETAVKEELRKKQLYEIPVNHMENEHQFTFVWRKKSIFEEEYLKIMTELKELWEMVEKIAETESCVRNR
ncbi:MAG: LysR family transcriptional regulator [Lachnospiraceae bacterium]|nr:LysR family transcriptional regulator [Lachnospiraceae bacterium]